MVGSADWADWTLTKTYPLKYIPSNMLKVSVNHPAGSDRKMYSHDEGRTELGAVDEAPERVLSPGRGEADVLV